MNYSIESKSMFLTVSVPVEVGQIKATIQNQLIVFITKDYTLGCDIDNFVDIENITYSGVKIERGHEQWNKIKEFHNSIGIDLSDLMIKEVDKVLTKETCDKIMKQHCSGLLNIIQATDTVKSTGKPTWDEVRKALEHKFGKHAMSGTYYNEKRKTFRRVKMGDYDGKKLAWLNKHFPELKAYKISSASYYSGGPYTAIKFDL